MMKRLHLISSLVLALLTPFVVALASPMYALADTPQNEICTGVGLTDSSTGTCGDQGQKVNDVISAVINLLSIAIGLVAVVMIVVGGLRFITSGGDSGKVASAKNTIIYALIGLVVVIFARIIVQYVIAKAS